MKNLTVIRGIVGIIALTIAGLFTFKVIPTIIGQPLVIMAIGIIIGLSGIDEFKTSKKATGYLLIGMGIALTAYYCFLLSKLF